MRETVSGKIQQNFISCKKSAKSFWPRNPPNRWGSVEEQQAWVNKNKQKENFPYNDDFKGTVF